MSWKKSCVSCWKACRKFSSNSGNSSGSGAAVAILRRYSHCPAKLSTRVFARGSASIRRTCCSSTAGSLSRRRSALRGRIAFHAEQEPRANQDSAKRHPDSSVESSLAPALPVESQERLDVFFRNRPAISSPRQIGENLGGARL